MLDVILLRKKEKEREEKWKHWATETTVLESKKILTTPAFKIDDHKIRVANVMLPKENTLDYSAPESKFAKIPGTKSPFRAKDFLMGSGVFICHSSASV